MGSRALRLPNLAVEMNAPDNIITTSEWTVSYEGESLANDSIGVPDLAQSLLSFNDLCLRSNGILNGTGVEASLRIRAARTGSFEVDVILFASYASNVLSGPFITSAANMMQLVVGSVQGLGVLGAFKQLRGRPYKEVERSQGFVTIEADEWITDSFETKNLRATIPVRAFDIYGDQAAQRSLRDLFALLSGNGIDKMSFLEGSDERVSLESGDIDFLEEDRPQDEPPNIIEIPSQKLVVVSPNFRSPSAKWRLSDGKTTNRYSIRDEGFLRRVSGGVERFGANDILVCRVNIIPRMSGGNKIPDEYQVMEVIAHEVTEAIAHRTEGRQLSLTESG